DASVSEAVDVDGDFAGDGVRAGGGYRSILVVVLVDGDYQR
ncbi:hypothetical protein Tco_0061239, partial [Tanacetum coccineum]